MSSLFVWNVTDGAEALPDLERGMVTVRFERLVEAPSWDLGDERDGVYIVVADGGQQLAMRVPRSALVALTGWPS